MVAGGYSVERLRVSRALSREFAGQPCVEDYQIVCYTVEQQSSAGPAYSTLSAGRIVIPQLPQTLNISLLVTVCCHFL